MKSIYTKYFYKKIDSNYLQFFYNKIYKYFLPTNFKTKITGNLTFIGVLSWFLYQRYEVASVIEIYSLLDL